MSNSQPEDERIAEALDKAGLCYFAGGFQDFVEAKDIPEILQELAARNLRIVDAEPEGEFALMGIAPVVGGRAWVKQFISEPDTVAVPAGVWRKLLDALFTDHRTMVEIAKELKGKGQPHLVSALLEQAEHVTRRAYFDARSIQPEDEALAAVRDIEGGA